MVRYLIFVQYVSGEIARAFTWNGEKELGIQKAKAELEIRGYSNLISKVWAEALN